MTARYNPHSIEKQARQWPVLFSFPDIKQDIRFRVEQMWLPQLQGWASPFACPAPFAPEFQSEYGVDACRTAYFSNEKSQDADQSHLLEAAFKWLARLQNLFKKDKSCFNAVPWLEAAIQTRDHILQREDPRAALATVRHAVRASPPEANLSRNEKALVLACLAPFAPILTLNEAILCETGSLHLPEIIKTFDRLICIRFSIGESGWNQKVFERASFQQQPLEELKKLKQVKRALGKRAAQLLETEGGLKICFL